MTDKGLFQSFHVTDISVQLMQSVRRGACQAILTGEIYFSSVLNFKMTIGGFQVSRFHEPSFLTHTYVHYMGFK